MRSAPAENHKDFYLISELASILKVSTHTIRNLETEFGIEVKKDLAGKRLYTFSDIEKYRKIIDRKNSFDLDQKIVKRSSESITSETKVADNTSISNVQNINSSINSYNRPLFSYLVNIFYSIKGFFNFNNISKFSLATFLIATFSSFGSFYLDSFMDINSNLNSFLGANSKVSNVLQSTDENWDYRFDVNVPAYFNNSLVGSAAAFDLITVGDRVIINPNGISAPNIINTVRTLPDEQVLLVDITNPNSPIFSINNNPTFNTLKVKTLNGVTKLDNTTIKTIEDSINLPTNSTNAETIGGLSVSDFLRSNANTIFSNGIMTFDTSSTVKFNNLDTNTFLKLDSDKNLVGYQILPGLNVSFTSDATSLTINIATGASSNVFSSVAVQTLFIGGTSFDPSTLIEASATEINKLHNISGNILTTTNLFSYYSLIDTDASNDITNSNLSSSLFSLFSNLDTDATNDITTSNLASSIFSAFPQIDTNSTNDVLISSLASLMLSNYVNLDTDATNDITNSNLSSSIFSLFPNLDTNAADDTNILQDAVLVGSLAGKNVYSENTWYGYQNFNQASASVFEVELNGKIQFNGGVLPGITDNSLYSYNDVLYFQEAPLAILSDHSIIAHNNKFAIFSTNAQGNLQLSGANNVGLSYLQTGTPSSILGMDGSTLRYLNVVGDLSVSTTSSSTISFSLNTVNSDTGTYGSANAVPQFTVNSKGLITSVTTVPLNIITETNPNNYVTGISFSTPAAAQRMLTLQRFGLSNLTSSFTLISSDITTALGYAPLKNTTDTLTGNFGVTGNFSAATASFTNLTSENANITNLTLANALGVIYGGTGTIETPQAGQLLIGNGIGYTLTSLTAGTNVTISTGAGSITISAVAGGTNANNYVNSISFSDTSSTSKTLTLTREGLSNLTATFSISAANVTSALGYTPFNAANFTSTSIINTLGYTPLNSDAFNAVNITNALGYVPFGPTNFIAGSNITLSSTATSLTINSSFSDTTNANNYVNAISFSDASSTAKTLTLTRDGLSNLTATFSISSTNVISALGYTPLKNTTDTLTGNLGVSGNFSSANAYVSNQIYGPAGLRILNGLGSAGSPAYTFNGFTATGLYYSADPSLRVSVNGTNSIIFYSTGLKVNGNLSASSANISGTLTGITGNFTSLTLTNALSVIYGGTGLTATPDNGQLLIGNGTGYSLSALAAGTGISISTGAGSIQISSSIVDTNNYVTAISFSDASATTKTLTLTQNGLANLTATFSISAANVTSALGYTPLRNTNDTLSGNLTITATLSAATIFQNGNRVCDFSGNCAGNGGTILGSGNTGYLSLFTATNSIGNSSIFQSISNGYIGIGTTNPEEQLDVFGAIKLSQDMGTAARGNALYQSNGVLYWNGQAVGVVGSTAPGGISGKKDYIPYFNTKDTLIASDLYYESGTTERSLELITSLNVPTYLASGHKNDYSFKLGVASDSTGFFTKFDSEDDVVLVSTSNLATADLIFALQNSDGKILFAFDKGNNQVAPFAMNYNSTNNTGNFGINTTNPSFNLEVVGSAKITNTLAVKFFSNPSTNSFEFLSGANFMGNLSAGSANLTGLTLANALSVIYGGTGLTATPNNGQLLIGNGTGYTLSSLVAGSNVSISTGAGSIQISSSYVDTNNYVTAISFSNASATSKTLTLTQNGLENLTATFSISAADITSALNYVPFNAVDFTYSNIINTLGYTPFNSDDFNAANITNALNYVPFNAADFTYSTIINTLGYTPLNSDAFNAVNITNALGYVPFGPTNFIAGSNVSLSSTATSLTINSSYVDTNNYVTAISFSNASATSKTLTLTQNGLANLTATFSISAADVTSALNYVPFNAADFTYSTIINTLGYTPLNSAAFNSANITNALSYVPFGPTNFIAGSNVSLSSTATSLTISSTDTDTNNYVTAISFSTPVAGQRILNLSRVSFSPLTASLTLNQSDITTALGYTPLANGSDFMTGSLGVAGSFSAATGRFTNLTLANALSVIYGGTGLTATPDNGQLLIGNGTGYSLSALAAGTGISISTGAGSIQINSSIVDTNNYVTAISFSDASATTKTLTLTQNGLANLTATFSISAANVTSALGYTPLRNTNDTMSGNLTVLQTLSSQDVVVLDNFWIGDYNTSNYRLQIEPKIGTLSRRMVIDMASESLSETTLGMFIQSVKFSAPSSATTKNITFNQIGDSNLVLDMLNSGTLPAVSGGVLDTYNSKVSAAALYLAANTTNTPNIRFTSSAGVNVAAPSAGDLWFNGTSLNFYNGSQTIDLLSNPLNFFGSQLFSGANTTLADGAYIEVAHNTGNYDVIATGWVYNTLTSKWEQVSPNQGANLNVDLMEYSTDNLANAAYTSGTETIRTASGGTVYYTDSTGLNSSATPYLDGYVVHTFTAGANQTFTTNYNLTNVTYLIAGGGGAGGRLAGGGGGGADVNTLSASNLTMTQGTYTITVGTGASGLAQALNVSAAGGSGQNSTITGPVGSSVNIVASGGCGGAGWTTNSAACTGNGGGQGGSTGISGGPGAGNFAGGTRSSNNGGGGGGMGGVGGNAGSNNGGDGGVGITSTISGTAIIYGAGGGGGGYVPDTGGAGGSNGVGGAGGDGDGNPLAGSGVDGTGSGGGGGGYNTAGTISYASGSGGDGIVIIRYPYIGNSVKAYSEAIIKTQGSNSLKIIAGTDSLNKSITKTFASGTLNLSNQDKILFYMRASRTGSNVRLSLIDNGGMAHSYTPEIKSADTWEAFNWDITAFPGEKDNITSFEIEVVNADAANTFYIDDVSTNNSYKILLNDADTARLYNYSGQTQNMRLVVSAKSSALFQYALGYTPLRNDSDYMRGNLGVTGSFSAASGVFTNLYATVFSASTANLTGLLTGNTANFSGNVTMGSAVISGNLSVGSVNISDTLNGALANFSGNVSLGSAVLTGNFIGSDTSTVASGVLTSTLASFTNLFASNFSATSGFFTNMGVSTNFSAANIGVATALSAANASFTTLNAGSFSATSGFLTNMGVTTNFSAANVGVATALSAANASFTTLNAGSFSATSGFFTNMGVTTALSSANARFTTLNTETFSGTAGFLTNFGVTSNLSAATATFRGTVTVSNPSGGTQLNLVSDGGSGNNIELGFYNGADKRANFSMDSTNTFEFEGASGVDVHFNATSGTYRFFNNGINLLEVGSGSIIAGVGISGTTLGLTGNLSAANATFTNLNATTFSGTAGFLTNFGVTTNFSAANIGLSGTLSVPNGRFSNNLGVGALFSAANGGFTNFSATAGFLTNMGVTTNFSAANVGVATALSAANASFTTLNAGSFSATSGFFTNMGVTTSFSVASAQFTARIGIGTAPVANGVPLHVHTNSAGTVIRASNQNGFCTFTPITTTWSCTSDERLKENIVDSDNILEDLMKYRIREYTMRSTGDSGYGVIAQEVQQNFPNQVQNVDNTLVVETINNWKLLKGIQELNTKATQLSSAIGSMNLTSMQNVYNQFMATIENLSMSTENGALVVNTNLTVTGEALFNNATFTGDVAIGQIKFDSLNNDISINGMSCTNIDGTLNNSLCETQTLFVMKNKAGNLNFFDGKVVINPLGEMTVEKITAGEVAAAKVKASEYEVVAGSEVSGNTQILSGQTEITILTSKVKANSKVFVTANGDLDGRSLFVTDKVEGVSFKVKLNQALTSDVNFDWFILNSE